MIGHLMCFEDVGGKRLLVTIIAIISNLTIMTSATEIPVPPSMLKQPPHEQLFQVSKTEDELDKPFTLDCVAEGNPEPNYRWKKNGLDFNYVQYDKRISQHPRRGTLVFIKPDDVDDGLYQCFAENVHGTSVSNAVFLRISELNSFPDEQHKEIYVAEGDPLTLNCNPPAGYPRPNMSWVLQSSTGTLRSINSSRITVDPEGDLHFSNVTREDSLDDAAYACSANSYFRNEYSFGNKIVLKVKPSGGPGQIRHLPQKQYVSPPNIVVLKSHRLQLSCIYGGTPLPDIVWKKIGGNLLSDRFNYLNYGKTLEIRKVDFQDEGTYECTASNDVGVQQSYTMAVTVEAAPYWITSPNNTDAAPEETVSFECTANGLPEPKLQWFINGVPLADAKPNARRRVEGNILTIENLEKFDTAVYQCNASNVHGYAFKDFYLNVLALLPTINQTRNQHSDLINNAVVTSDDILRCRVFGATKPTIICMRNGQELAGGRYKDMETGDLKIKDAKATDQADYTCYASNKFNNAEAFGKLEIKSQTEIKSPPSEFEVTSGQTVTFPCIIEHDLSLQLEVQWLFNGKEIDLDQYPRMVKTSDNSLIITKTINLDSGVYTCIAKTDLDQAEVKFKLTIQDTPNAPRIISVSCDRLHAQVEWQPTGDGRSRILSYTIQLNTSFTPDSWETAYLNIPATDTKYTVSMSPWANYTFRVIARNKFGPSNPSDPSDRCTTPEDVPHKNPDKVTGRGILPRGMIISWSPMSLIEHNAPNLFYKVFWKRNDLKRNLWHTPIILDWQQNHYVVVDAEPFKPYRIKVEAHNRKGQAYTTAAEIIGWSGVHGKTEISSPPSNFEVPAGRSATFHCNAKYDLSLELKVQWLFNGQDIDFDLDPRMVQSADNSLTVSKTKELDSGVYTCIAKTDLDQDEAKATLTVQDTPNAPRIIGVICDGLSARVEWQPTGDGQSPILSYTIQLNTSFTPDSWETEYLNIPATDTKYTVFMSPWANYTFRVIARNKIGLSEPSDPSDRCTTPEDVPYKNPNDVTGRGILPHGMIISWLPMSLIEHNAPNFFYKVFWKRNDLDRNMWYTHSIFDWQQNHYVVVDAEPFKPYRIKVEAHNRKGQPYMSAAEIIGWSGVHVSENDSKDPELTSAEDAKSHSVSQDPV